jgi:L1 cell adhesion molecule like protein
MKSYSIGIDLGTTHSCVGLYKKDGIVEILHNEHGYNTTPSYVSFTEEERHVGKTAKDLVGINSKNTVYDAKRLIGRKYSDKYVQKELKHFSFGVEADSDDKPVICVEYLGREHKFHPEQISAMILEKMKKIAETYVQDTITDAVITVPAYFTDSQRQATKDAGQIAGINVLRIINEPTAAAIAYGLDNYGERTVLIYDFGGGTLDVTILSMVSKTFIVKSTSGDTHLGGEDLDNRLSEFCLMKFATKHILKTKLLDDDKTELKRVLNVGGLNLIFDLKPNDLDDKHSSNKKVDKYIKDLRKVLELRSNVKLMRRLKTACEEAKKSLSSSAKVNVTYENFYDGEDLDVSISRSNFEELCEPEFKRCLEPVFMALEDADMTPSDIDDVVLVGGSTRIPRIHELLNEKFEGKLRSNINPDEAVAYGAAVQAAIINGCSDSVTDGIVLVDVTPLSLGIEKVGGGMEVIIPRNSSVPAKESEIFSTYQDNQSIVTIKVFEGERALTKDNHPLGKFSLKNIPPRPKGIPKIKVTFEVDINGIMTVSAEEVGSENSNNIIIKNEKGRLTQTAIAQMIDDAEKFKENDKKIAEKLDAKMNIENYISSLRRTVNDLQFQDICGPITCKELTEELDAVTNWLDQDEQCDDMEITKEIINDKYKIIEGRFLPIIEDFCVKRSEKNKAHNKPDEVHDKK